jgi:hypothetical protein
MLHAGHHQERWNQKHAGTQQELGADVARCAFALAVMNHRASRIVERAPEQIVRI